MQNRLDSQGARALAPTYAGDTPYFFSSPNAELLAYGPGETLRSGCAQDAVHEAERVLSQRSRWTSAQGTVVAGALPFDRTAAPSLRLHTEVLWRSPHGGVEAYAHDVVVRTKQVSMQPTPIGYTGAVERAVAALRSGALSKVVLARALDLELRRAPDLCALLTRLSAQNPGKYVFSCDLPSAARERRVLIGASPELLVQKRDFQVRSHPLAGSAPRSRDAVTDAARAQELLHSQKNRREHRFVVVAVADALSPYCSDLRVPKEPALVQTGAMWHLGSEIVGRLRERDVSSLRLAAALHPTPAVCGEPPAKAQALIEQLEGFDRGFFAGAVGYCDSRGDGEWAVAIRCAEAQGSALRLYAGAGIVAESSPAAELEETTAKLNTMLSALGITDIRQVL